MLSQLQRFIHVSPCRQFASAASGIEALSVGGQTLVTLGERQWSPQSSLSSETVSKVTQAAGSNPDSICILRDAFSVHTARQRPISQILRQPNHSSGAATQAAAIHHAVAAPATRVLVDSYTRTTSGEFRLSSSSVDLLTHLSNSGVRMTLSPTALPSEAPPTPSAAQSSNAILMVAPTAFGFNEQTAHDNHFMHVAAPPGEGTDLTATVAAEFAGLHHELSEVHGVNVSLMQHSLAHGTPDAVFPNNWFSTHAAAESSGTTGRSTLVLYPMKCPNRAAERRPELVELLKSRGYEQLYDMSGMETESVHFEGTGVLVLDRVRGIAYVALSERADRSAAEAWVDKLGYKELVAFHTVDRTGLPIYHTNVMMAIGTSVAIVCGESVRDAKERQHLFATLGKTHDIVDISFEQMEHLCGNAIEVQDGRGLPVMAMSTQAHNHFTNEQRSTLLRHCAALAHAPIDTLETVGGGSVRCTIAELF